MEGKTASVNDLSWKSRDDGNGMSKLLTNLLDPDAIENGIPLSPQWLQAKPEKPPGELAPRSSLHFDPSARESLRAEGGRDDRRSWRNERWREDGRDGSSHTTRRERYDPTEARRMDRWGDSMEGRRNDRWSERDTVYDSRRDRDTKWNTRWGPDDKEKDRRDKWVEPDKDSDNRERQHPVNTRENEPDGARGIWIPPHARRSEAPPALGSTPPKNAPGFGRGRGERFTVGRGRSHGGYTGTQSNHIGDRVELRTGRSDGGYRYPRGKLLDIYKSCSYTLPEGFIEVEELTVEEPVKPLAVVPPDDEEELVLEAIQKGDIIGTGAAKDARIGRDEPRRPRLKKDDNEDALGLSESEHFSVAKAKTHDAIWRRDEETSVRFNKETRWEDDMDPYKEDQSWKSSVRKDQPKRPEDLRLCYTDPQGAVQGPFEGSDIIRWFEDGYFNIDLPVRPVDAAEGIPFVPLGNVMPHLKPKARVPPGFDVKMEEAVTGLRSGLDNLHVDSEFAHAGLEDNFLARKRMERMAAQVRQPDSTVFPANWPHEVSIGEPDIGKAPARSDVMVSSMGLPLSDSWAAQHDISQLQLQPELLYQVQSPLPQRGSSGHFLEQLHPGSNAQQQAEQMLKMRQQQQQQQQLLLQRQQLQQQQQVSHPALLANYDYRLPNVVEARTRQPEMDLLVEKALRPPANPLDHLTHLKLQHESAFRQFFPDERQLMRQASLPQQRSTADENRMSGVWELDDYGQFVRSAATAQGADTIPSLEEKRNHSHGDLAGNQQVLDSLQRLYSGMQTEVHLERNLSVGRVPADFHSEGPVGSDLHQLPQQQQLQPPQQKQQLHQLPPPSPSPQQKQQQLRPPPILQQQQPQLHQPPLQQQQVHLSTQQLQRKFPEDSQIVSPNSVSPSVMTASLPAEQMDTPVKTLPAVSKQRDESEAVVSSSVPQVPEPVAVQERTKAATQIEAPAKVDDSEFLEPKEVKKNKKRAKNKLNKSTAAVAIEVPKVTAPTPKQVQETNKEVLPSPPPGPSLGDFMFVKDEPAPAQTFPAWSVDRQMKPAKSLKEIQEAERQAREEQERRLKQQQMIQMQLQQQQQAAQKPLVSRSNSGSAWQKSSTPTTPKPKSKFEDDDDLFWDYEDVKPSGKADRHENRPSFPPKPVSGFRQAAGGTGPVSAPNNTSDFPSLSSSKLPATSSNARKPAPKSDVPPVSAEAKAFKQWCESQMRRLTGNDDMTLLEFCVSLPSSAEAGEYLTQYLGSNANIQAFKAEFLQRKEVLSAEALRSVFTVSDAVISDRIEKKKAEEGEFEESKAGKKKAKKGKKVVDPSYLGFNVTSNRILMGEIQHVDD